MILIEEMLGDGAIPPDYKLWVFGGKVEIIQVDVTRFERHERAIYDRSWNKLPVSVSRPTTTGSGTIAPMQRPAPRQPSAKSQSQPLWTR